MVYAGALGSRWSTILLKYAVQWIRTHRIVRGEQPDTVFVMTPPVFAALPAFWYAWRHGKQVVFDAHTAAFLHPRWQRLQWLQRLLCRRAATTLVHTEGMAEIVRAAGGHATLVPDVPVIFPDTDPFPCTDDFVVAVVCSFNPDEPVDAIAAAARALPDVRFFMTGNAKHLDPRVKAKLSSNVTLTGFLSTEAYGGLLKRANVVLALTTRDHTMLRAAYEAVYQGTPVIVSDWPVLRNSFGGAAAFADNSVEGITAAIADVRARLSSYRSGAARLSEQKLSRWHTTRAQILERIAGADTTVAR